MNPKNLVMWMFRLQTERNNQQRINNIMNYLTNHYKNLCEQLQNTINSLEFQLSEAMSEDEARGMPVPMLKTGKGGNYAEWRAANDARNAALRQSRLGTNKPSKFGEKDSEEPRKPRRGVTKSGKIITINDPGYTSRSGRFDGSGRRNTFRDKDGNVHVTYGITNQPPEGMSYDGEDYVEAGNDFSDQTNASDYYTKKAKERDANRIDYGKMIKPDRKPLFPGMEPNPGIKPGLKPVNPSKIPSDLFRPGKRPKGEPNPLGITPETDRDDLYPGARDDLYPGAIKPKRGGNQQHGGDYFPTPGRKPEIIIPRPQSGDKPKIDYNEELPRYITGSLPKLGDSNLIGKIPTEKEAYGSDMMSSLKQSGVDLEGKPTGLSKSIPVKPKIDPRYKKL